MNIEHDSEHPVTLSGSFGHVNSSIGSIVFPLSIMLNGRVAFVHLQYILQGELTPVDVTQCCKIKKRSNSVVYISLQAGLLNLFLAQTPFKLVLYRLPGYEGLPSKPPGSASALPGRSVTAL